MRTIIEASSIWPSRAATFKPTPSRPDFIQMACQFKLAGARRDCHRAPLVSRQPAYKPGSGWHADDARMRDGHSSGTPVTWRLQQPTRTAGSGHRPQSCPRFRHGRLCAVPMRSCSRWGLPCRRRCRRRGALLPHHFTLTARIYSRQRRDQVERRFVFCGTVPGLAPAGCYPAPLVHGARTFLPGNSSPNPPHLRGTKGWKPPE